MEKVTEGIAKYVISRRYNQNRPITNLDLQNIMKMIQEKTNCFYDEYHTNFGYPVYPNLYYRFCGFGSMPICLSYNVAINDKLKVKIDKIIDNYVDNVTRIIRNGKKKHSNSKIKHCF